MKKKFLFSIFAMLCMVFATSCQNDEVLMEGNEATVTFEVGAPNIATRAYSDGMTATQLLYAVYDNNGVPVMRANEHVKGTATMSNGKASVQLQLAAGKTYNVLFWAAAEGAPYTIDTDNLTMTVDYSAAVANDEMRDAFYCYKNIHVEKTGSESVTLTRPFAQLNIGTNDLAIFEADHFEVTKTQVKVSAYNQFNLATGAVEGNAETKTFAFNAVPAGQTFPVSGYEYLAMNYLLVGVDKVMTNVEFSYSDGGANTQSKTYNNIPLQRNYRTNIYGQLLTNDIDVNVDINPDYNPNPDHNVGQVDDVAAANAAFANGATSVIISEVKDGQGNIILPATTEAVYITLPQTAVPVTVNYATTGDKPAQLTVKAAGKVDNITFNTPASTVYLQGSYGTVTAYTASNTLIITDGATVENINVGKGNVVIETGAQVEQLSQTDDNTETTIVTLGENVEAPEYNDVNIVVKEVGQLTFDELVAAVIAGNGTFDGKDENGANVVVKITPVSGKAESFTGLIPNRLQKYSNPDVYYAQYQRFETLGNVEISHVDFKFVPAEVTVKDAWNTAGATATAETINGELQFMNNGSVTLNNCTFDMMSVSLIKATELSIEGCTFSDLKAYAIKDINATDVTISSNLFDNCNGAFWFNNPPTKVTATANTFTGVGRRGAIQFSANGNYAQSDLTGITGNTVTDNGAFLWQLNTTIPYAQINAILTNNAYTTAYVDGSVKPVAAIGENAYFSLQAAFDAVNGEVVTLISDIVVSEPAVLAQGKTATLDLNGHILSAEDETKTYVINNLGTLTLKDSKGTGAVNARGIYNGYNADGNYVNDAKIVVESGTYNAKGTDGGAAIFSYGILEVNGGTFTSVGSYSLNSRDNAEITINNGANVEGGMYLTNTKATINGGNISGKRSGSHVVYSWNSTLTIDGGEFYNYNSGNATIFFAGSSVAVINDGTFGIAQGASFTSFLTDVTNTATMTVNGGIFNGASRVQAGTTMTVNGGKFKDVYSSGYNIYDGGTVIIRGGYYAGNNSIEFARSNVADDCILVDSDDAEYPYMVISPAEGEVFVTPNNLATTDFNQNKTFKLYGDFSTVTDINITPTAGIVAIIDAENATFGKQIRFQIPRVPDNALVVARSNGRKGNYTITNVNGTALGIGAYGTSIAITESELDVIDVYAANIALDVNGNTIDSKYTMQPRVSPGSTTDYGVNMMMMAYDLKFDGNTVSNTIGHVVAINGSQGIWGNATDNHSVIKSFTANTMNGISGSTKDNRAGFKIWDDVTYAPNTSASALTAVGQELYNTLRGDSSNKYNKATNTSNKAFKFSFYNLNLDEL